MKEEVKKLHEFIGKCSRILITSHISPDPDAVSSVLLLMSTLRLNFPDKTVEAALEEKPSDLDFMEGYSDIIFGPLLDTIESFKPELLILLDGNNYERASRKDGQKISEFIKSHHINTAIIDHHEEAGKAESDVFINYRSPSTVQDVYRFCFEEIKLKKPTLAAQTAMVGFYADTGGFIYVKAGQPDTVFGVAEKLVQDGADVEAVRYQLEKYSELDMAVIGELASNISHGPDYNYSFLSDAFIERWLLSGGRQAELQRGANAFLNNYIRSIDGRSWGFIVYKNSLEGNNIYSVSLRSQAGVPDVSRIAGLLGGGGHKPAAGARFEAVSAKQAVKKVKTAIAELA